MLVTLLLRKNLHELNGRLHKFVALRLNFLQNSVAINGVSQDVEVLCVQYFGPNIVQTNCLVIVGSVEVEL